MRAYDFMHHRTHDGRPFRLLSVVDDYTRESLAIYVARQLHSENGLERLARLFLHRGILRYIRSDNGPEFTAEAVRDGLGRLDVGPLFIQPAMLPTPAALRSGGLGNPLSAPGYCERM